MPFGYIDGLINPSICKISVGQKKKKKGRKESALSVAKLNYPLPGMDSHFRRVLIVPHIGYLNEAWGPYAEIFFCLG